MYRNHCWRRQQKTIKGYEILLCIILQSSICFAKFSSSKDSFEDNYCADYDSCEKAEYFRTCDCEDDCSRYGTCCADASELNLYPLGRFECYSKNVSKLIFVKETCSSSYDGNVDVISSCQYDREDWSDLMGNVLVSSNKTWITYKNWNCALCNDEEVQNLWFWRVQAAYPIDSQRRRLNYEQFRRNIVFNQTFERWGVYSDDKFIISPIELFYPTNLQSQLKFCAGTVVSDCPSVWPNDRTRQQCRHSHYGERRDRVSGIYFKNVYCAVCNGFDVSELDCSGRNYNKFTSFDGSMAMKVSFNLNPWTGEHTDTYMECASGLRYDPFLKTCRSVNCGLLKPRQSAALCDEPNSNNAVTLHDLRFINCSLFIIYLLFYVLR